MLSDATGPDRFVWSRRYAAGAGGVRGFLITILGQFVRRSGEPAPSSAFVDLLGRLGAEEKAARQALTRAAADGWVFPERRGRYTFWHLSPSFEQFLNLGSERIFRFTATQRDWDGRLLLVLTRGVEADRSGRHLLRTRLRWAGFGNPVPGVWLSTHLDRAKEAEIILGEAGMRDDAQIFVSELYADTNLPALVRQSWDLDELEREYAAFLAAFKARPAGDPMVQVTRLVHEWRRILLSDPALPRELLPPRWNGILACERFHRLYERWRPAAADEWRRISAVK